MIHKLPLELSKDEEPMDPVRRQKYLLEAFHMNIQLTSATFYKPVPD